MVVVGAAAPTVDALDAELQGGQRGVPPEATRMQLIDRGPQKEVRTLRLFGMGLRQEHGRRAVVVATDLIGVIRLGHTTVRVADDGHVVSELLQRRQLTRRRNFEVPTDLPELTDSETYIEPRRGEWDIGTCLQEIGENNADNAHLQFLHGSPEIPPVEVSDEGHIWNVKLGSDERGLVGQNVGPGIQIYRHVRGEISMLMFSAPLPITRELTRVRMLFSFKNYAEGTPERLEAEQIYQHSIGEAEGEEGAGFESVDLIVWANKKYRPRPLLCDGDGPIAAWRKYYQQFYAEPSKAPA